MTRDGLRRDHIFILTLLVPIIIFVAILIYYPAIDTFATSLTNRNLRINRPSEFVQLENYSYLLTNNEFWEVTGRSFLLVIITSL